MIGELVKPLVTQKIDAGTELADFLKANNIEWSSSVRVNGGTESKDYKLADGDIITTIGSVRGGM